MYSFFVFEVINFLAFQFDSRGNLLNFDGTPILLSGSVPRDPDVLKVLDVYRPGIDALYNDIVGVSKVFLNGTCRFNECNLGNFITDAMLYSYASKYEGSHWSDAGTAFLQGGGT